VNELGLFNVADGAQVIVYGGPSDVVMFDHCPLTMVTGCATVASCEELRVATSTVVVKVETQVSPFVLIEVMSTE